MEHVLMTYLEGADVARVLGVASATVRLAAAAGRLRVAAVTPRGTRLYDAGDVETYRSARLARLAVLQAARRRGQRRAGR